MTTYTSTWVAQPNDDKDWIYSLPTDPNFTVLPEQDLRKTHHMQSVVYDQGSMGSCTANAICSALRYGKNAEVLGTQNESWDPSRMFVWFFERMMSSTDGGYVETPEVIKYLAGQDQTIAYVKGGNTLSMTRAAMEQVINANGGANERDGFKLLTRLGVCSENTWPYVNDKADTPPADVLDAAQKYFTPTLTYWRIPDIADGAGDNVIKFMEGALSEKYPIVFGFRGSETSAPLSVPKVGLDANNVYTGFVANGEKWEINGQENLWGHCVVCVGFNRATQCFLVLNSWGTDFGDGGYFWMPYKWFSKDQGMFTDANNDQWARCDDIWVVKNKPAA